MYVILVYDINQKRVGKALKICRNRFIEIETKKVSFLLRALGSLRVIDNGENTSENVRG